MRSFSYYVESSDSYQNNPHFLCRAVRRLSKQPPFPALDRQTVIKTTPISCVGSSDSYQNNPHFLHRTVRNLSTQSLPFTLPSESVVLQRAPVVDRRRRPLSRLPDGLLAARVRRQEGTRSVFGDHGPQGQSRAQPTKAGSGAARNGTTSLDLLAVHLTVYRFT